MNQEMRKIQQVAKGPRKHKLVSGKKKMLRVTRGPLDARGPSSESKAKRVSGGMAGGMAGALLGRASRSMRKKQ